MKLAVLDRGAISRQILDITPRSVTIGRSGDVPSIGDEVQAH